MLFTLSKNKDSENVIEFLPNVNPDTYLQDYPDKLMIRTSYQKVYLDEEKRHNPQAHIDDNTLNKYFKSRVIHSKHEHPVGTVFNIQIFNIHGLIEDYPSYSLINTHRPTTKQDRFSSRIGFFNVLSRSITGMIAFDAFNKYDINKEELVTKITNAYRK